MVLSFLVLMNNLQGSKYFPCDFTSEIICTGKFYFLKLEFCGISFLLTVYWVSYKLSKYLELQLDPLLFSQIIFQYLQLFLIGLK